MNKLFRRRVEFGIAALLLLGIEVLIGMHATGWIRNSLGDVLVIILLYTLCRIFKPHCSEKWYLLPTVILLFAFAVEFLQFWGLCDRLGITNRLLRIIIGTGFSVADLACYAVGSVPCYIIELIIRIESER